MYQKVNTIEIKLERIIDALPEEVYDVWLDKTSPGSPWFGVPNVILDKPKIDGLFYTMYAVRTSEFAHYGRFITLSKAKEIQYTWVSEATHGRETILTVLLEEMDGKTLIKLNHTNLPNDEGGQNHKNAWGYVLTRMTSFFNNN